MCILPLNGTCLQDRSAPAFFVVLTGATPAFDMGLNLWGFWCGCGFIMESDLESTLWAMQLKRF